MERLAASPPRRITRSSLARFAYAGTLKDTPERASAATSREDHGSSPDIEDVIPDTTSSARNRKRKRAATASVPRAVPSRAPRPAAIKEEPGTERDNDAEIKMEVKSEDTTITTRTTAIPTNPTRRTRRPARKTTDPSTGETTIAPPSDWEEIYATVRAMRGPGGAACNAPVDTMGCERLALPTASPRDQRLQTLVALMLSSQTKDAVTAAAMRRLQTELPPHAPGAAPGLTLENLLAAEPARLNELIRAVGFHNNKTRYLLGAAAACRDSHGGDIPDSLAGLVALPGVGPKMAHLCLSAAWGRTEGIGVDVHVHRITNLWGWHGRAGSRGPEDTRARLEAWLPRDRWREINTLLVGLGQTVCLPVGRRCGDCDLGLRGLCPAAERKKVIEGRRLRESVVVKVEGEGVVKVDVKEELVKEEVVKDEVDDGDNLAVIKVEEELGDGT
ncbi:DNA glycosylase [Nemania serpens]|nr:DNA glycosylase [Nemania serpens]